MKITYAVTFEFEMRPPVTHRGTVVADSQEEALSMEAIDLDALEREHVEALGMEAIDLDALEREHAEAESPLCSGGTYHLPACGGSCGSYEEGLCDSCGEAWPCPTIRLVRAQREALRTVGKMRGALERTALALPHLEGEEK